jgi:hypothetical protein
MTGYQTESAERQAALRRKVEGADGSESKAPEHPLLTLQSQIGNAQVARLLAQRAANDSGSVQASHDLSVQRAAEEDELQAKHDLSVQRAAEEDELQAKHDLSIQREGEEEELAAKHDLAQREMSADDEQVGIDGGAVGPDTAQRIQSARGGGSSLDTGTRASMESGFGTSFEDVRVHHDSQSDMLARRLTAHAFTTGSDIFLRGDASPSDGHLIAHELTHVVQQRSMGGGGAMSVGAAGDPHEHQADATADAVLSNSAAPAAAPGAQREAAPDEDEVAADHDLSLQRAAEEDELQADHDLSVQRAAEEDELQADHDLSVQRAAEEDELQADHDLSVQRAAEEDELQADHDVSRSLQREASEEPIS